VFSFIRKRLSKNYRSTAYDAAEQRTALHDCDSAFAQSNEHADDCALTPAQDRVLMPASERTIGMSPWVKRCQANDLPTFDRHNGAHAYRR
jgi:hypothetical protein